MRAESRRQALDALCATTLWRGDAPTALAAVASLPSGYAELDGELPGGGWPLGMLTEILPACAGIGELRLLAPALARLSAEGRHLAWIAPPHTPYAPALAAAGIDLARLFIVRAERPQDVLWAAEQALRARACAAVLAWPAEARFADLRRLQVAAQTGRSLTVLFRPPAAAVEASPAPLRLGLAMRGGVPAIDIFKRRGRPQGGPLLLPALGHSDNTERAAQVRATLVSAALGHALDSSPPVAPAPRTARGLSHA